MTTHTVAIHYNAGLGTYSLHCPTCGKLRGVKTQKQEAQARAKLHEQFPHLYARVSA